MAKDYKCKKCGSLVRASFAEVPNALIREKLCHNCYAKKHRLGKYGKRRANVIKRTKSNPDTQLTGLSKVLIVTAVVYIGACALVYLRTGEWSWKPWKQLSLGVPQIEQGKVE